MEKKSQFFLQKVDLFSSKMDFMMHRFIPQAHRCAVWTLGNIGTVYGFENGCHVDTSDKMTLPDQLRRINQAAVSCQNIKSKYTTSVLAYLKKVAKMIGLGYSTTCAYQHVYHPNAPKKMFHVFQYFVMPGLGVACPITDKVGHDFRAYAFSHYTSCCVVVQDGRVRWKSDGSVNVVAWGSWVNRNKQTSSSVTAERLSNNLNEVAELDSPPRSRRQRST